MKQITKITLIAGLIASFTASAADVPGTNDAAATPADGTIVVVGGITQSTCKVNDGDKYMVVRLPVIGNNSFKTRESAGTTPFKIRLENCPEGPVGAYFDATVTSDLNTGYLKAIKYSGANPSGSPTNDKIADMVFDGTKVGNDTTPGSQALFDKVVEQASTEMSNVSSKLFFRLLNQDFKPIKIGDVSQKTEANGMWTEIKTGETTGELNGAVEYMFPDYGSSDVTKYPDAGYYYSYTQFVLQYN